MGIYMQESAVIATAKAFIAGGLVIGGAKYVSEHVSPMWAALLGGLPTGIMTAMFLDMNPADTKKYYRGYILQSVILTTLIIAANLLLWKTDLDPTMVIAASLIVWFIVSVVVIKRDSEAKK